jgi:aminopeptidase N
VKEGLTVFRDQCFSADMRGEAVQRIKDVKALRARQFSEDAGPLAHPVRPSAYIKIDNFYTATIYEKGSEVIRMLKILLGAEMFRAGMDLYFDRHDGEATTVEAFIQCFADVSGRDMTAFFGWYEQAGTPNVEVTTDWDAGKGEVAITLRQNTAPTPGQPDKKPLPLPVLIGLLHDDGRPMGEETLVILDTAETTVRLPAPERPVLSPLRGFSAPVNLTTDWDAGKGEVAITLRQNTAPTPGQPDKKPLPLPVLIGLLHDDGRPMGEETLVILDTAETTVRLPAPERPVLSPLRGFSAPVNLTTDSEPRDRYVLLAADPDLFNRWEAGQGLARDLILARAAGTPDEVAEERYAEAVGRALADQAAEPAFKALILTLPSEPDLSMAMSPADPAAIHDARNALRARLAVHLGDDLRRQHTGLSDSAPFSPDAASAGRRALRNATLELLAVDPHSGNRDLAARHFETATNMTDAIGGLNALIELGGEARDKALADFHARWKDEPLVLDKWFAAQARDPSEQALGGVLGLTAHPDFDGRNPNRLRALVSTFANFNPARFHDPSGDGYRFLADQIIATDTVNPMTAARLVEPLGSWRRYRPELGALMKAQLERIIAVEGLSKNVFELASKALG